MKLLPRMNDLFDDKFFAQTNDVMKTDVKEDDNGYTLSVELPGFNKEDIHLSLNNGYLTINASTHYERSEKDIRVERYHGSYSRSYYVGDSIKEEDIHASYKNGILSLSVPKVESIDDQTQYIEIH